MSQEELPAEQGGEIVVYEAPDGAISVDVTVSDDTVWLTQRQMADLFSTTVANVNLHINNLYDEGELSR